MKFLDLRRNWNFFENFEIPQFGIGASSKHIGIGCKVVKY
jgi:hypothetical protein